jgi:hypothetical protein
MLRDVILTFDDADVTAVSDFYPDRCERAANTVKEKRGHAPFVTDDYKEILKRDDVDVVYVATYWETHIEIAIEADAKIEKARDYTISKPVVFYGSSIVHGEGAMRPGNAYPAILSRRLDTDFINLGFRGNATAEEAMMKYIASLPMSAFVYDYDYNAPSIEHLEATHYAGYEIFREKQPKTPVIFASSVDYYEGDVASNEKRRNIIKESYYRALAAGDRNVYFIDGAKIYPSDKRDECSADCCHPNDMGYSFMADAFGEIIKPLIETPVKKKK